MSVLTRRVVAVTGAAAMTLLLAACGDSDDNGGSSSTSLRISANAIAGGKNAEEAQWIEDWVIPEFVKAKEAQGMDVSVTFDPAGIDDEQFKSRLALDLQSGSGPDIFNLDGIWVGEFAQAEYIQPLHEFVEDPDDWEGWDQIPDAVQQLGSFEDDRYGIPVGTDARVIYYNKDLFAEAGLDREWQPTSWAEIQQAAEALAGLDGVIPLQLNAGTAMGEATTMQGFLPLLAGAGEPIWEADEWTGDSAGVRAALGFYEDIYADGLGDPLLQQEAQGRDKSFEQFAAGQIGMLLEGDYFWRSVVNPENGIAPMADRDEVVGYAKIPAATPGSGIGGQDFVSYSGGAVRVVNPASDNTELAFELLTFMSSADAYRAWLQGDARITARTDVNEEVLADDPMLSFINDEVLPITSYRPPLAEYPAVSVLLQEATAAVVSGTGADAAAEAYGEKLSGTVSGG